MTAIRTVRWGVVTGLVTVALVAVGALEPVELATLNRLFELRGARVPVTPIIIVTIDEDSFDELDLPWPFPRALHAKLIETIAADGPIAIGVDVLFSEPSPRGPGDDEALGEAVARAGRVVLAAAVTLVSEPGYTKVDFNQPLPVIRRGAAAVGPVSVPVDPDGSLRRVLLRYSLGDRVFASFDAQLHGLAKAAGIRVAPLPASPETLVNFRGGPRSYPWIPYHRVVRGEVPPATFRDRIVLVGTTSAILQDVYSTPFAAARTMPGVEFHANALETLLLGIAVREAPRWVSAVLALAAALAGAALVARLRALRALAAAALLGTAVAAGAVVAFAGWDVWCRPVAPTLALVLGYGTAVVADFVREQRERSRLSRFFSPSVLAEIVRQRGELTLESHRRMVTVLFSDIRGFTALSERVAPELVVEMLREYLGEMTEVIFHHGGTVDKYVGDCVMALYNAPIDDPEHAINAVRTALALQERTFAVSARWESRLGSSVRNGVGINTGEALVGTMGARQRLEYTAIGDVVNIAAHLEALTKEYPATIIISESTYEAVKGRFLVRRLGTVGVKGRVLPVRIWGVLARDMRRHPRTGLGAAGAVTVSGAPGSGTVRVRDLGAGGIAVLGLPETFGPGMSVRVQSADDAVLPPLVVEGAVVWRDGNTAGIAFEGVPPETETRITEFVRRKSL